MTDLPARVVVGANGAYWRDYGDHYSMCPVSEDNDPVEVVAVYVQSRITKAEEWVRAAAPAVPSLTVDEGMAVIERADELSAMALHRWRHPTYKLGERTCRCRADAQEAMAILLGDMSAERLLAALATPEGTDPRAASSEGQDRSARDPESPAHRKPTMEEQLEVTPISDWPESPAP